MNWKKAIKADKCLRTIAGCLVRELKRNLGENRQYDELLSIFRRLAGDRGYRGKKEINGTQILIPDTPKAKDTYYQRKKKHKLFCKRVGIEPTIGHLKTDYRLERNFYKGLVGDAINVMLAAATYHKP